MKKRLIDRIWQVLENTFPDSVSLVEDLKNQEGIVVACKPAIEDFITEKVVMGIIREVIKKEKIKFAEDTTSLAKDRMIILTDGRLLIINVFAPQAQMKDLGALIIMISIS